MYKPEIYKVLEQKGSSVIIQRNKSQLMRDTSHLKKIPESIEEPDLPIEESSDEDDYDDYEFLPSQKSTSSPREEANNTPPPVNVQPPVSPPVNKRKSPEM